MTWNFDMAAAPRGRTETRSWTDASGKSSSRDVFISERIIAAADDDKQTVTLSNWLPDQERWNMFNKDAPPVAWMPWPEHPAALSSNQKEAVNG